MQITENRFLVIDKNMGLCLYMIVIFSVPMFFHPGSVRVKTRHHKSTQTQIDEDILYETKIEAESEPMPMEGTSSYYPSSPEDLSNHASTQSNTPGYSTRFSLILSSKIDKILFAYQATFGNEVIRSILAPRYDYSSDANGPFHHREDIFANIRELSALFHQFAHKLR